MTQTPAWLRFCGNIPHSLSYPEIPLYQAVAAAERALIGHCRAQLIKWSCPREIEFCAELPKTRVGKVDYKVPAHIAYHRGGENK